MYQTTLTGKCYAIFTRRTARPAFCIDTPKDPKVKIDDVLFSFSVFLHQILMTITHVREGWTKSEERSWE